MKILKTIILYVLFLFAMILGGTATIKVLSMIFQVHFENIWSIRYKVGIFSWLVLSVVSVIYKIKRSCSKECDEKQ